LFWNGVQLHHRVLYDALLAGKMGAFYDQCLHFVNDISFSVCRKSPGTLVTVNRHAANFKAVEPLFNLSDPHCTIAKRLMNFADCFCFGIPKFPTKLYAVPLLQVFFHLE
jgi:hypothetical protein